MLLQSRSLIAERMTNARITAQLASDLIDHDLATLVKIGDTQVLSCALDAMDVAGDLFLPCVNASLLGWSIKCNQICIVLLLIRRGVDLNRHYGLLSPLQSAAVQNNAAAMHALLRAGADPNSVENYVFFNQTFIAMHGAVAPTEFRPRSPLLVAIQCGAVDAARCLLQFTQTKAMLFDTTSIAVNDDRHRSIKFHALHEAVRQNQTDIVECMLAARPECVDDLECNCTALHWAVRQPDALRLTALLLDAGAEVDARANDGRTALMRATHIDTARLLVERGAQVHAVSHLQHNVFTMLNLDEPNLRARIRLFVRAGGTLDMMRMRGPSRLRHAAVYGNATATLWLLACGVDPDSAGQHGHTLLHSCRSLEIVSLLIAAGADQRDLAQSPVFSAENVTAIDTREANRQLGQMRFELIRMRALDIAVALQNLRLPALLTTMIVDEALELAPLTPMHLKWKLVTLVKHWKQ